MITSLTTFAACEVTGCTHLLSACVRACVRMVLTRTEKYSQWICVSHSRRDVAICVICLPSCDRQTLYVTQTSTFLSQLIALCILRMVLNVLITLPFLFLIYSDYIFHGAAFVALPCSCRWAALFHCLIAVSYLLSHLLCLLMYNKWNITTRHHN